MKWVYGKQDWKTFERGLENCYLITNGLGGYSSLTITGAAARGDHAFFMACTEAPNHRYNMIQRLEEQITVNGKSYIFSTQEYADGSRQEGYRYLSEFSFEDTPVWRFHINGVEIEKEAVMRQGENTIAVCWRVMNRTRSYACLAVTPYFRFAEKGQDICAGQTYKRYEAEECSGYSAGRIESGGLSLEFYTNGKIQGMPETAEQYYYAYDACDGRTETGAAKTDHRIVWRVGPGEKGTFELLYILDPANQESVKNRRKKPYTVSSVQNIIEEEKQRRTDLTQKAGFLSETASFLTRSADQFLSRRESTGGKTILAGFPFFEDWGRDTMIALPGICLSTGRCEEAKSILRTFAAYEKEGLMPNLFPEGEKEPMYNTADASLLFINCVFLYFERTRDKDFAREMYPVMRRIVECYQKGTKYGIHVDSDGLLMAGKDLDQVTWMDVRAGDILPTPRHGKPVEINAYWYNALRIMEKLAAFSGDNGSVYAEQAEKVKTSFNSAFWMEDRHCLKDVISGTDADCQIRCNQIWALSLPFTMLEEEKERQVVDTVFEKLYTPYGLRTLDPEDPQFHPVYEGEMLNRDMAYHQGTVWTYPLGGYYLAYLKINHFSREAKELVKIQLEVLESAIREGCIGQLPEIYDGGNPVSSKGCFAQAWSVGELLRVYEALEYKGGNYEFHRCLP